MRGRRPAGMAFPAVLMTLALLVVMGMGLGMMGMVNLRQIRTASENTILLQAAHGGLHDLMARLKQNPGMGTGSTDLEGQGSYSTSLAGAYYWWTFDPASRWPYSTNNLLGEEVLVRPDGRPVPPHCCLVTVSADQVPREQSRRPLQVAAIVTDDFQYAVATDGSVLVSDVTGVGNLMGNVRSNRTGGRPNVQADTVTGFVFSRDGEGSVRLNRGQGSPVYKVAPIPLPDVPIGDVVASQFNGGTQAHVHTGPGDGAHPYGGPASIQVRASAVTIDSLSPNQITINGTRYNLEGTRVDVYLEATGGTVTSPGSLDLPKGLNLFVKGNLRINGSLGQTEPRGSGGLQGTENFLWVTGSVRFNGGQGTDLNIFAGTGIEQNGSSNVTGILYVRNGNIEISGGGSSNRYQGTVIARGGGLTGELEARTVDFVYDPRVLVGLSRFGVSLNQDTPMHTRSWWVVQ
ncbi:MAG TPA: hypothetical protein VNO81_02520 [Candidatus Nitrosotenuis sp.]|nr:hypothetical protein [Candidatus Nitrosotenuis sp.]